MQFPYMYANWKISTSSQNSTTDRVKNYRPITPTTLEEDFEKVISKPIIHFLQKYEILADEQCGFRCKPSTLEAKTELTESTGHCLSNKDTMTCTKLDLSKAFDTVDHGIMIKKCKAYALRENMEKLISTYLKDRFQYVVLVNAISSSETIAFGVPQGPNFYKKNWKNAKAN